MQAPKTLQNIESAFAGESMAFAKYMYFAKVCRASGDEETAKKFEETAAQEILHAHSHLELLYPMSSMTPVRCLEMAIAGETYEYTEMYPKFREQAKAEGQVGAIEEIDEQIHESMLHAASFKVTLAIAEKRFNALAKIEKRHAESYNQQLERVRR